MTPGSLKVAASRLMRNANVALTIEPARQKLMAKRENTAEKVLDKLADTAFAETGNLPSHSERIRALELPGKHLNLFSEKSESSFTITHELAAPLAELSVEELKALVARGQPPIVEGEYREAEDDS